MLDKLRKLAFELEGAILIVLIGVQFVAVPATYALCLAAATDWTWYNLIPRVVGYAFASVGWAVYWPLLSFLGDRPCRSTSPFWL